VRQVSRERVAVFIDWQNLYKGARDAFHGDRSLGRPGMVDSVRLGLRLLQLIYGPDRELTDVWAYRCWPDPTHDPTRLCANRRWQRSSVMVLQRPLRYPKA
jgi:hypothetical protein